MVWNDYDTSALRPTCETDVVYVVFPVAVHVERIMYEIIVFVAFVWVAIKIRKWMLSRSMMQSLESKHVVVSKIN
jgi:hypothetical protein